MKPCPFCAEDIQNNAIVCKHCGSELTAIDPTTVEATGKKWKGALLVGAGLCCIGVFSCIVGYSEDTHGAGGGGTATAIGVVAFILGFCVFIGARIGAWWHHG